MERFEYVNVATVGEALTQLGDGREVKAGGVDLLDRMKEGLSAPKRIVNIRTISSLEGITTGSAGLEIRPLTTLAALAANPELRARYRAIASAAEVIATPQIRNMATAGGNLLQRPRCWYFRNHQTGCLRKGGDGGCFAQDGPNRYHAVFGNEICAMVHPSGLAVPLTAFGATLELTSADGARQVPIAEFFVKPEDDPTRETDLRAGEILTAIRIPAAGTGTRSAYLKQKEKESADWPLVDVAVVLDLAGGKVRNASIVLGSVAAIPWRVKAAEAELTGKRVDEKAARSAAAAAVEGATPLAANGYKVDLLETIVRRTILEATS